MYNYFDYFKAGCDLAQMPQLFSIAAARYLKEFNNPTMASLQYFLREENCRLPTKENFSEYLELSSLCHNLGICSLENGLRNTSDFLSLQARELAESFSRSLFNGDKNAWFKQVAMQKEVYKKVAFDYPEMIKTIEPEYGFHFENPKNGKLIAETERFFLYQIFPAKGLTDMTVKPVLIIPPYVLGANILGFLPREGKSYAHAFANKGIPVYIRIMKDIQTTPALRTMSSEDDVLDTRYICEEIKKRHGLKITLNGYCQGGYTALCCILSGRLDGLVDALITCVAPMDGTRSQGLHDGFLKKLPERFNNLAYGTKMINGHRVADGDLMGWVYKLKSLGFENPLSVFIRDCLMWKALIEQDRRPSKTALAINRWLRYERTDLPIEITKMSHASYTMPISKDGVLPIKLFGKKLCLEYIRGKRIPWQICYGKNDDLVEAAVALAPVEFLGNAVEVSGFPKGHVAIATSWSHPNSGLPLDGIHPDGTRGPVRFHLDLYEVEKIIRKAS